MIYFYFIRLVVTMAIISLQRNLSDANLVDTGRFRQAFYRTSYQSNIFDDICEMQLKDMYLRS